MVKYLSTALALKLFSCNALMRSQYRSLGNRVGGKRRRTGKMPAYYPDRVKRMLRLVRQHGIVRNGDRILELGTGWLHWEAMTLRLFYDVRAVLFDVWDNRQLGGLKNYIQQLDPLLDDGFGLSPAELKRAHALIKAITSVQSFDELYKLLDFEYVVESSGSLARFSDGSFQLVVSAGVFEHISREAVPTVVAETRRLLVPGGWVVHSIDTSDHLAHYDRKVSRKKYLSFSETTWKALFENQVQYINRLQRGDWLRLFAENGLELIEEECHHVDITGLKFAKKYAPMPRRDLECTVLRVALKKTDVSASPAK